MGFIFEKGTYLRDFWNVIDFIVVLTGFPIIDYSKLRKIVWINSRKLKFIIN